MKDLNEISQHFNFKNHEHSLDLIKIHAKRSTKGRKITIYNKIDMEYFNEIWENFEKICRKYKRYLYLE